MLPARAPRVAAPPQSRFKHVVIGAGYTGLAAARRLVELQPQEPILVLDASSAGEGSAGRNSGFLINLPHNTRMSGHHSPLQIARKQIAMYQAGLDWLAQLSQQGGFDCGWDLAGKYHAAATEGQPEPARVAGAVSRLGCGVHRAGPRRDARAAGHGLLPVRLPLDEQRLRAARRADSRTGRHAAGQRLADGEQSGRIGGWRRSLHRAHAQWPVQRRQRDPGQQCLRGGWVSCAAGWSPSTPTRA